MSADVWAREWVMRLERNEAVRSGRSLSAARVTLSRKIGVPPGTLENIRRGRSKGVRAWVEERLRSAVVAELEREMVKLDAELSLARHRGLSAGAAQVIAAEAAMAEAKEVLKGRL